MPFRPACFVDVGLKRPDLRVTLAGNGNSAIVWRRSGLLSPTAPLKSNSPRQVGTFQFWYEMWVRVRVGKITAEVIQTDLNFLRECAGHNSGIATSRLCRRNSVACSTNNSMPWSESRIHKHVVTVTASFHPVPSVQKGGAHFINVILRRRGTLPI